MLHHNLLDMAKEKKILITIPPELNSKLNLHLLKIRDLGVDKTKVQLCIELIQKGLNNERN